MGLCVSKPAVIYAYVPDESGGIQSIRVENPDRQVRAAANQTRAALKSAIGKTGIKQWDEDNRRLFGD